MPNHIQGQIPMDYIFLQDTIRTQPSRTAYIDECGSFGFDFTKQANSLYYIMCAVVIKNDEIDSFHEIINDVKNKNGFKHTEMKSSSIGKQYARRTKIITELLPIKFNIVLFVANKQEFIKGSPLTEYKPSFIKFLHEKFYDILYRAYPKLKIIEDEVGTQEFQESFRKYVENNRPSYSITDEYDFDYADSKDSLLVQLSDIIAGSIYKSYTDPEAPDYLEILKSKVMTIFEFPSKSGPYFSTDIKSQYQYNENIFLYADRSVRDYIEKHENDDLLEERLRVYFLNRLLFYSQFVDARLYITSKQLVNELTEVANKKITNNYLMRNIVAKLRDNGIILASSKNGYKLPISSEDIFTYLRQTHGVVAPMMKRVEICRNCLRMATDNSLDILNNDEFIDFKKYID